MIPLKIKLCLSFFIVVKNKALVKAQMRGRGASTLNSWSQIVCLRIVLAGGATLLSISSRFLPLR